MTWELMHFELLARCGSLWTWSSTDGGGSGKWQVVFFLPFFLLPYICMDVYMTSGWLAAPSLDAPPAAMQSQLRCHGVAAGGPRAGCCRQAPPLL